MRVAFLFCVDKQGNLCRFRFFKVKKKSAASCSSSCKIDLMGATDSHEESDVRLLLGVGGHKIFTLFG